MVLLPGLNRLSATGWSFAPFTVDAGYKLLLFLLSCFLKVSELPLSRRTSQPSAAAGSAAPSRAQDRTVANRPGVAMPRTRVQIASGQSVLARAVLQRDGRQVVRVRLPVGVLRHVPDPRSGTAEAAPHGRAQAVCRKAGVNLRTFECGLPASPAAMMAGHLHPQPPAIVEGTDAETRAHRSHVGQ